MIGHMWEPSESSNGWLFIEPITDSRRDEIHQDIVQKDGGEEVGNRHDGNVCQVGGVNGYFSDSIEGGYDDGDNDPEQSDKEWDDVD